jgi:hypothetical protein
MSTVLASDKDEDVPDPGQPPKGMAVKVFKHPVRGEAKGLDRFELPLITQTGEDVTHYGYSGIHWGDPSNIKYYVNTNYSSKKSPGLVQDKNKAIAAIDASFNTWEAAGEKLVFTNAGKTSLTGPKADGKNVVAWKPLQTGYIAVTYVWYYTATGHIAEFDMLFNNSYAWDYTVPQGIDNDPATYEDPSNTGPAYTFDLRNIATHEAGHTLMLDDIYNDNDGDNSETKLTMYGYGSYGELLKDTLQIGDHLGVHYVYP